jgi:hypothetical protein
VLDAPRKLHTNGPASEMYLFFFYFYHVSGVFAHDEGFAINLPNVQLGVGWSRAIYRSGEFAPIALPPRLPPRHKAGEVSLTHCSGVFARQGSET